MPFSHHSHSGQFCHHAKNTLEEVVQTAITKRMSVLALTEHMPRVEGELYPEEVRDNITPTTLATTFATYYTAARHLQRKYSPQIHILVGVEVDWIHPTTSLTFISQLTQSYHFDLLVGGVHHVHGIPTDYDRETYLKARAVSKSNAKARARAAAELESGGGADGAGAGVDGGSSARAKEEEEGEGDDEYIFTDYLDHQHLMLLALRPDVVAHFDVIRLWSDHPDASLRRWPGVWERVVRNLRAVREYGGVVEVNSAGLRKGMREPYPGGEICREFLAMGGQFTLSDDSHGVAQVATHYAQALAFLDKNSIDSLVFFLRAPIDPSLEVATHDSRTTKTIITLEALRRTHPFFS